MGQRLGQHFLVDRGVLAQIVSAGEVLASDLVLEIGPGKGVLTEELVKRAGRVVAIEKDEGLAKTLRPALGAQENLEVITGDALEINLGEVVNSSFRGARGDEESRDMSGSETNGVHRICRMANPLNDDASKWKLIANIPYEITSPLLFLLFDMQPEPERVVLLIQKEVADRLMSPPGRKSRGIMSVFGQLYADIERVCDVPSKAFNPPPNVESMVIRLKPHSANSKERWLLAGRDFRCLVKAGFSQKRKQLKNALGAVYHLPNDDIMAWLSAAGLEPMVRAEELAFEDWGQLFETQPRQSSASQVPRALSSECLS